MNPSPGSPEHRDLVERLGAYVLDGLDATERREVDAHLATCPSCRAELAAIAPIAAPLAGLDPERLDADRAADGPDAVPPGFDEVLRRVRAEEAPDVAPVPTPVPQIGRAHV